jgi:8-oxo-dGTP pyrophosphatase MutT (NUDIX family)
MVSDSVGSAALVSRYSGMYPHGKPVPGGESGLVGFPVVECGGVVLVNEYSQILIGFNFKRQVWDVPQGVVEPGELPVATALRELLEETGIALTEGDIQLLSVFNHQTQGFVYPFRNHLYIAFVRADGMGNAKNLEPEKCRDLHWTAPCQMPSPRGLSLRVAMVLLGYTS